MTEDDPLGLLKHQDPSMLVDMAELTTAYSALMEMLKPAASAVGDYRNWLLKQGWSEEMAAAAAGQVLVAIQMKLLEGILTSLEIPKPTG